MRFERSHTRKTAVVAVAGSLALLASACGGDDGSSGDTKGGGAALEGRGPITFATGKDTSGNLTNQVAAWNSQHPDEKVEVKELPESADQQRQQMVQNAQAKSDAFSVLNLDVVWTAEFAANRWVTELPQDQFPDLGKLLPSTLDTGKYRDKLYAVPVTSDGGLLYYRSDWLTKAGVQPPKTWAEMQAACAKVIALPEAKGASCYAGQFEKYEGLTVNFSEAVNSAGGVVVGDDGKPNVDTPEALAGLQFLVDGFKKKEFPAAAITYKEEEGRRAFQEGKLVFHRNWPYVYALAGKTDGSSKIAGKFAGRSAAGQGQPGRLDAGWPQLRDLRVHQEQGDRGGLHQVHVQRGAAEGERGEDLPGADLGLALRRPGAEQAVPLPGPAEGLDRVREVAAEGGQVRRRHDGCPGRRVRRADR